MDGSNAFIHNNDKSELRKVLAERRKALSDKPYLSRLACERACELVHGNVMAYISFGSELDTGTLVSALLSRKDVVLYAPFTDANGAILPRRIKAFGVPNRFGNLDEDSYFECEKEDIVLDFCITPLLGFNGDGYRIGYGKGCYDKFFSDNPFCTKIGLAFECQRQEFTPEKHDVPLDICVTEKTVYFNKRGSV